jgi:hypothetical protein
VNTQENVMTFVNEKISDADQQRINYSALKDPHTGNPLIGRPCWTVDRDRDAFLIGLGGGMSREDYHVPYYFLFSWKGTRMRVDAYKRRMPAPGDPMRAVLTWEVVRFDLPETLCLRDEEEVVQMLTEALQTYGTTGTEWSHLKLSEVHVDLPKAKGSKP